MVSPGVFRMTGRMGRWRRGQAPKPHRGAPKAQGLTAAIAVAGPSPVPSIAPDDPVSLNSTGADVPMPSLT